MIYALDTESFLVQPGLLVPKTVCLTWYDGAEAGIILAKDCIKWIRKRFANHDHLIGHNIVYDLGGLAAYDPSILPLIFDAYDRNLIKDPLNREKLIAIRDQGDIKFDHTRMTANGTPKKRVFTLDELSQKYRGIALDKDEDGWRLRFGTLDGVPLDKWPKRAIIYAQEDAIAAYEVCALQDDGMNIINEDETNKAHWALFLMSAWGIRTDRNAVAALKAELEIDYERYKASLIEHGIMREDGTRDMKVLRAAIENAYKKVGKEAPRTSPTTKNPDGQTQTSAEVIEELGDSATRDPALTGVVELAGVDKMLNTFVPILEQGVDYPINADYRPLVATGRTSCGKPPMQQPPRKGGFRECFVPRGPQYETLEVPDDYVLGVGEGVAHVD